MMLQPPEWYQLAAVLVLALETVWATPQQHLTISRAGRALLAAGILVLLLGTISPVAVDYAGDCLLAAGLLTLAIRSARRGMEQWHQTRRLRKLRATAST